MIGVTNDEQIFYGSMLYYWRKQQHNSKKKTRIEQPYNGKRK